MHFSGVFGQLKPGRCATRRPGAMYSWSGPWYSGRRGSQDPPAAARRWSSGSLRVSLMSTMLGRGTASGRTRRGAAADGATCRDRTDDYRFHKPGLYR